MPGSPPPGRPWPPAVGLSVMPEPAYAMATLPLFADGVVDTVEWSFDLGWGPHPPPDWLTALLDDYAEAGLLSGHGVSFSLLSQHPRQDAWLDRLRHELASRPYARISEHVGFMAAGEIRRSSPLPMPRVPEVVDHGRSQIERIVEVANAPIGLENLATALSPADIDEQGALCEDLLSPSEGWLVLDLHNLFCQAANSGRTMAELLSTYPLDRVREVHVSGGSWWQSEQGGPALRRDTHDDVVPAEVLDAIPLVLDSCPRLEAVLLERLGHTLGDPAEDAAFRAGFLELRARCGAPA